jgi:RimJ/RimL family protein N-acetyltransferase
MWRMGLGREIGAALLGLAFERLGADTVWSKVMGGNAASARLAQTIGMRRTSAVADYAIAPGVTGRVDVFTMTAARYFERSY